MRSVINFLATSGLRALLSDKEGFFVITPEEMFAEKAMTAIHKNFRDVLEKLENVKQRALELPDRLSLRQVSAGVKDINLTLVVFSTTKTRRVRIPFRTIVSERATRLRVMSGYLQKHLDTLRIVDPFGIPNSSAVGTYLKESNPKGCTAFSVDVEDLYYSLPHD